MSKLGELSHAVDERMNVFHGTRKRHETSGRVFLYTLEPGDQTLYNILISPLSDEMGKSLGLGTIGSKCHMVTLIMGDSMKSFPVDLQNVWNPGYLKHKFQITDNYTHKALYMLLSYIGDELITEKMLMVT